MPFQYTCETCGTPFTRAHRKPARFCSRTCQARANPGRKPEGLTVLCEVCGTEFYVKQSRRDKARFCSSACWGVVLSRERAGTRLGADHPNWKGGISARYYRRFRKDACERCASAEFLLVHHRDWNRTNGNPSNFETLCKRCHAFEHDVSRNLTSSSLPVSFPP
jgi:hypothetical protein